MMNNLLRFFKRHKDDIRTWYNEMETYGLLSSEIKTLEKYLLSTQGVADTQEAIMMLSMDPAIANFSITEANMLRKGVAKKSKAAQEEAKELFFTKGTRIRYKS